MLWGSYPSSLCKISCKKQETRGLIDGVGYEAWTLIETRSEGNSWVVRLCFVWSSTSRLAPKRREMGWDYRKCRGLSTTKCTSFLSNGAYFIYLPFIVRALKVVWPGYGQTKQLFSTDQTTFLNINIRLKWL